jgi:hypothetical protein
MAISAAVTALTQLAKWQGVPRQYAPLVVVLLSILVTALWAFSQGDFGRQSLFSYFAAALTIAMSAVGIYGFATREAPPPGRR